MALVPHKITALAQNDADGTDGSNIVAGAVVSLYDTTGSAVFLYDDESGSNGSTAKQTDSSGQVVVWVTPGEYDEAVNGSTLRRISIFGNSATEVSTFAELELYRPYKTGQVFICQERSNAKYIVQAAGYTAQGGDVTFDNGRVGALQPVNGRFLSSHFGVVSGVDDTDILSSWLSRKYCHGASGIYSTDKIEVTNDIYVTCDDGFTIKAKSEFDSTSQEGLIEVDGYYVSWVGGLLDGNKSNISGNITDIELNKRKGLINLLNCSIGDINVSATNHFGFCFLMDSCEGGSVDFYATESAYLAYIDKCDNVNIKSLVAFDMDNVIDGDLDKFQNVNAHVVHILRCNNSPIGKVFLSKIGTRPGRLYQGDVLFFNGFTQSACVNCPVDSVSVFDLAITQDAATDLPSGVAANTSILPLSLVSNDGCNIGEVYTSGQATQAIEIAGGAGTTIGFVDLKGNYGRQGVISGSSGVEVHGTSRYQDNVASSKAMYTGPVHINGGSITGFHNGVELRKGTTYINGVSIYGCRKNGVNLDNNGNSEWSTSDDARPSASIIDCDIQYNGFNGVNIVTAREVLIDGGIIANNAQRSGFTDATTNSQGGSSNIRYDTDGGVVDKITIGDIDYDGNGSIEISSSISYLPGLPSSYSIVPDSRLKFIPITLSFSERAVQGMRLTISDPTGYGDVTGWLKYGELDKWLLEIDSSAESTPWTESSNIYGLTGLIETSGDALTGTSTLLESEVLFPNFIKAGSDYALILNVNSDESAYINDVDTPYDGAAVLPSDLSGVSFSSIVASADLFQSTSIDEAGLKSANILSVKNSVNYRESDSLPLGDIFTANNLTIDNGAGTEIVDTSDIGVSAGGNRVFRIVMSRPSGSGFVVAVFGEASGALTQISIDQVGSDSITFAPTGTSLVAIGSSTLNWDVNMQQIGTNGS